MRTGQDRAAKIIRAPLPPQTEAWFVETWRLLKDRDTYGQEWCCENGVGALSEDLGMLDVRFEVDGIADDKPRSDAERRMSLRVWAFQTCADCHFIDCPLHR